MACSTLSYEIKRHSEESCYCGIISRGTVESFGDNLYQAQFDEWGEERYTLAECRRWIFDLFVVKSLKGNKMERKVVAFYKRYLPHLKIVKTSAEEDISFAVDFKVFHGDSLLYGIQVKPTTYKDMPKNVCDAHKDKQHAFLAPVLIDYYDNKTNRFVYFMKGG